MDITQLILGFVAKFLDNLKLSNRKLWLIIGAIIIAAQHWLLNQTGFEVPAYVVSIVTGLALLFNNARANVKLSFVNQGDLRSDFGVQVLGDGNPTLGDLFDSLLAKVIDTFKVKNLTLYIVVGSLLLGFQFLVASDGVSLGEQWIMIISNLALLFSHPSTSTKTVPQVDTSRVVVTNTQEKKDKINGLEEIPGGADLPDVERGIAQPR